VDDSKDDGNDHQDEKQNQSVLEDVDAFADGFAVQVANDRSAHALGGVCNRRDDDAEEERFCPASFRLHEVRGDFGECEHDRKSRPDPAKHGVLREDDFQRWFRQACGHAAFFSRQSSVRTAVRTVVGIVLLRIIHDGHPVLVASIICRVVRPFKAYGTS